MVSMSKPPEGENTLVGRKKDKAKGRLLIVDDTVLFLRSFMRLLSRDGYEVTTATNGLEAMEELSKKKFDLIVTDINMPRMNGFELLRKISETKKDMTVIVLTAFGSPETEQEALELGASDYLEKPVHIEYIKEVIKKRLEIVIN